MAARRLIAVLVVLLAFSIVLAALNPVEAPDEPRTTTSERTTDIDRPQSNSETVKIELGRAGDDHEPIELDTGDRLVLTVRVDEPVEVVIPGLGLREFADPLAPARFDLIADRPGRYPVRLEGRSEELATIRVAADA